MHFKVHNKLLYNNKYELEHEKQEKKIMKENLDSISDRFEGKYFEVKKLRLLKK